jgi:cytochrome c1
VAAFFLKRQLIRMPAFGPDVTEDEIRQIGAYIEWLRERPAGPHGAS